MDHLSALLFTLTWQANQVQRFGMPAPKTAKRRSRGMVHVIRMFDQKFSIGRL